jgi:hypothetical protein
MSQRVLIQYTLVTVHEGQVSFGSQKRLTFNALLIARRNSASETANTTDSHLSSSDYKPQLQASQSILRNCRMNGHVGKLTRSDPLENSWFNVDLRSEQQSHKKATNRKRHPQPRADFPCECVSAIMQDSKFLTAQEPQKTGNLAQLAAYRTSS